MSDISQGPGWWQAADGKWYAPELHPNYQPPAAAPQPAAAPPAAPQPAAASQPAAAPPPGPMAAPPQMGAPAPAAGVGYAPTAAPVGLGYNPPPAKKSGVSGCLVAFLVVFVLSIVAGILIVFFVGRRAGDAINNAVGVDNCPFLTAKEAEAALGGTQIVSNQGSLAAGFISAIDNRVLPNAPSCTATGTSANLSETARVAKYDGADAATVFQNELTKAKGSPDSSGPVTVTGDNYFLKDVPLDDEAFCTKELLTASSGVLARKGNTLVYVSLIDSNTAAQQNADDVNCDNAQKLASKVLG